MTDDQSKRGSFLAVVFTVFSRLNAGGGGGGVFKTWPCRPGVYSNPAFIY